MFHSAGTDVFAEPDQESQSNYIQHKWQHVNTWHNCKSELETMPMYE